MYYAMRTIKDPTAVVSAAKIEHRRYPCVAITRGATVEIYNLGMKLVDVIHPNGYVTLIVPVPFRNAKRFLMVCSEGEYVIMSENRPVVWGKMPTASLYTRCVRSSRTLVFIAENSTIAVASLNHDGLVFGDDINDFGYYRILDCFSSKGDVAFLLEDISGDVFYSRYLVASGKPRMALKEKALLRRGLVSARPMGDGLFLIGGGKLYYYAKGRFILESEFANPGVKNSLLTDRGVLLSMEDGELIRVSLERSVSADPKAQKGEDVPCEELSLKIEVLGNLGSWLTVLLHLEDELYYGGSFSGDSYYLKIEKELKILRTFENNPHPRSLSYFGASFKYIARNAIKKITYAIDLLAESRYNLPRAVRRFGMAGSILIVSYPDEGKVFTGAMDDERCFDEIMNIHIDNHCYFNTKNHVFCLRDGDVLNLEIGGIVLSSYDKDLCIVFTRDRLLKAICLETMACVRSLECPYEVSLLHLSSHLFISTYYDEFIIMDRFLRVMHKRRQKTLKSASVVDNRLFFSGMDGVGYEAVYEGESEMGVESIMSVLEEIAKEDRWKLLVLRPSFSSDCMIEAMVPVGRYIMGIGRSTIFVDLQDFTCHRCSLEGISHAFVTDQLYVSVGKSIHRCHFGSISKVKISTEDRLQEASSRNEYVLKFSIASHGREITGLVNPILSVDDDAVVNSYLTLKVRRYVYNFFLQDEMVMDARFLTKHYFVVVSNLSKESSFSTLAMFSTRGNCIKLVYEVTGKGIAYALDSSGDYLVTHRGPSIYVYKRQAQVLVELCAMKIDFIPYRIVMHGDKIACSCIYRSFGVFTFNQETNHLSLAFLSRSREQVESMVFALGRLIVSTTDRKILLLDENYSIEIFFPGDEVTSMCPGSLSLCRSDSVYFTTRNGSLGILTRLDLSSGDTDLLLELEKRAGELVPFPRNRAGKIINIDTINNMSDSDLEDFIATSKYDRNRLIAILNKVNDLH
ncbi:hypothetical protein M970_051150 [Encephalitozoon cuniculi EcunIII-L]|nr:hypothetical protein M970_051150 [Encephalitozoon cuniculi EcunIII-L]